MKSVWMSRGRPRRNGLQRLGVGLLAALLLSTGSLARVPGQLRGMTHGMDDGSDLGYVLGATTLPELLAGATATFLEVQASDINARAARLADPIVQERPAVIGLQEISTHYTGPLPAPPAPTLAWDGLQALLDALSAGGLPAVAPVARQLVDVEAPEWH
jgi:hypothetical protein